MEIPEGCKVMKVQDTCHSGFLWAFEFLNYAKVSETKKKLHFVEDFLKDLITKNRYQTNFKKNQFVAVVISPQLVFRGYILSLIRDKRGGSICEVFLIDYGDIKNVDVQDLRELPGYASIEKLPAQSWRIGLYGVLPVHIQLELGGSANRTVGESWNGKDIQFIENILKQNDTINFLEVVKKREYRFGYIYLKNPATKETITLQKLLVDKGFAVEVPDFKKYIPSIVKRMQTTQGHISYPTGDQTDDNDYTDTEDNEIIASLEAVENSAETPQTEEPSPSKSSSASVASKTSPSAPSAPIIKVGKGRGELLKRLKIVKAPPPEPDIMVGRVPMNLLDQFEDSLESVYHDCSPKAESSRRESTSSIEFQTPKHGSPSTSRRQSSSSVEIITPEINRSKIKTISLITPPSDPAIISYSSSGDNVQPIDLTTSPPTVSLITPSPSPHSQNISDDSSSEITSQSGSFTKRGKGRGKLLNTLSSISNDSLSAKSDISHDSLSENLSRFLKIETTLKSSPRGRGGFISRLLDDSSCSSRKSSIDSIASVEHTPPKPSTIDFTNDIVPLNPAPTTSVPGKKVIKKSIKTNDVEQSKQPSVAHASMFCEEEDTNDELITKIMVVGNEGACRIEPKFAMKDFDLHPDVKNRAGQLRLTDLIRSQRYMIPAVLTRRNVTLVGPSKGGKTVSCLIALFSLLKDKNFYKALPIGPGPRAIILCPYSSQCENIDRKCSELNKLTGSVSSTEPTGRDLLKINVAYGCGKEAEKDKLNELTQGYDIVICTPSCLLRLLDTPEMMNFKRLCHLVLDDADTLFKFYTDEVIEILQKAYSCGKRCENGLILPQRVIISKEWIPMIKQWVQKDVTQQQGILLMASYSEAAVFSNVKAVLRRIDHEDKKRNDVMNYLHHEAPQKSTVIVFNTVEGMNEVYAWLKSKCMRPLFKVGYSLGSARDIVTNWRRSSNKQEYPIMCCTDDTLHDLYIYDANSLIHYNLPLKERGYFTERFSVLLNRLAGPPEFYSPGKMPLTFSKTDTLIYIGSGDHEQFPAVIKLMEKLRMKIPEELKATAEELLQVRELKKDCNKFCENYKKFGQCLNEKLCKSRHYFSQTYDQPADDIPKRGHVKMQILQVYSASHYCVRLLEHRDLGEKKWSLYKPAIHPAVLNTKMNAYFSDRSERSMLICQKVGEVAAIELAPDIFKRVEILGLIMDEKFGELRTVKVKFIDDGRIDYVRPSVLVKLPEEFSTIPSTTVDIFLCNVLPVDRDIEWGDIINNTVRERIQLMQESEDILFIGEIKLVSGRDVWINPLQCHKVYEKGKDVIVIVSSMCKDLQSKKVAVGNPEHLPKLLSMYQEAGLLKLPETNIEPLTEVSLIENKADVAFSTEESQKTFNKTNDSIKNVQEEWNVETINESSRPGATVVQQSLNVTEHSDMNKDNSAAVQDDSEEEWELTDEQQTPAAPIQNGPEANVELDSDSNDADSECDQYDYETDSMAMDVKDDGFDYYFKDEHLDELVECLFPGFKEMKKLSNKIETSRPSITAPPVPERLTTRQIVNSDVPQHPIISQKSEDMKNHILKPKVEWYQNQQFVYLNISLNVDDYVVRFTHNSIYFRAVFNERTYEFDETLYTTIEENNSKHYKSGVMIVIKMEKIIKRNKWRRVFKNVCASGWIKYSVQHLDEDVNLDWDQKLNTGLALKEPDIPEDFKYASNYNNPNIRIYPEGYEELERDSDDDSDEIGNDNPEE